MQSLCNYLCKHLGICTGIRFLSIRFLLKAGPPRYNYEFICLCACVRVCIRFFLLNAIRCLSVRICTCVSICVGVSLKFVTVVNSLF